MTFIAPRSDGKPPRFLDHSGVESHSLVEETGQRQRDRALSAADIEKTPATVEPQRLLQRIGTPGSVRRPSTGQ